MAVAVERMSRRRAVVVWGLVVVATVLMLVSSLTIWAKRQLLDTDQWTASTAQLLESPQIRAALAVKLEDALYQRVDATAAVRARLPEQAQAAAPVIAAALQNGSGRAIESFLATPRAQALWERVNRKAHATLVKVLEGKDVGPLETVNGDVVLDLRPMMGAIATRLGFADRLKARASPESGQIVLLESDQLGTVQNAVQALNALTIALVFVVLFLYGLAIYLARGRRRILLETAGGCFVLVGLVLLVARRILGNVLLDSLVKTESSRPAANTAWLIATDLLRDLAIALIVYGLLAILAGTVAGPSRAATWTRRRLAPGFGRGPLVVHGVGLVLLLILIAWGPVAGNRRLIGTLILAGLFFLGLEVLRRLTLREFPPEEAEPPRPEQTAPVLGD
jgi:hypothetical protein